MGLFNFFGKNKNKIDQAPSDKRITPRWKVSMPAKIKLEGSDNYLECEVMDLNLKGFSLVTSNKIAKKETDAKLYFSDEFTFNLKISIHWEKEANNKYTYGIRFDRVTGSDREKICKMMKDYFPANIWWKDL